MTEHAVVSSSEVVRELTPANLVAYLRSRGIAGVGGNVTQLTGGVSGRCFMVSGGDRDVVVKQALAQLSVEAVWTAKVERALTEAAALKLVHSMIPDSTPQPVDVDGELFAITMTAAPANYRSWKETLLARAQSEEDTVETAALIGAAVGTWHQATWGKRAVEAEFDDYEAFEQLRVSPFHRTVLSRYPDLQESLEQCIRELSTVRQCFVHGDLSPKNILIGDGVPWIIDFEVGHFGAAVFDLAFLECHLMLKAIHQPDRANTYRAAADAFHHSYREVCPLAPYAGSLGWHTSSLLLARVDGKSPAGYLTEAERGAVRSVAIESLAAAAADVTVLWDSVERGAA